MNTKVCVMLMHDVIKINMPADVCCDEDAASATWPITGEA